MMEFVNWGNEGYYNQPESDEFKKFTDMQYEKTMREFKQIRATQPGFWGDESALKGAPVYINTSTPDTTVVPPHAFL